MTLTEHTHIMKLEMKSEVNTIKKKEEMVDNVISRKSDDIKTNGKSRDYPRE